MADRKNGNRENATNKKKCLSEDEGAMKYSDRHLAGLSAGPPDRVELIGAGSLGYGTGPSFG